MTHELSDPREARSSSDVLSDDRGHHYWGPTWAANQPEADTHEHSGEAMPFIVPPRGPTVDSHWEPRGTGFLPYSKYQTTSVSQYESQSNPPSPPILENPKPVTPIPPVKPLWNVWWLEIFCTLLGFASFAVIIVVLSRFDGQGLPDWPSQVTLNTFVAFFTTLGKAAFMVSVPKAIIQGQWTWFRRDRRLYDFHVFDQASRGAWGSLVMLWRIGFRHFAALGAMLTILSFLTSPLTQLAISYPTREVPATAGEAKALAIRTISAPKDRLDLATRKATLLATVADGTHFLHPIRPLGTFCSTGNCTFDEYQSLGICMKTANITSHLQIQEYSNVSVGELPLLGDNDGKSIIPEEKVWRASLAGGFDMLHQTPLAMLTDTLNGGDTFGFANDRSLLQTRIVSFILIYAGPILSSAASRNLSANAEVSEVLAAISGFQHEAVEILFHICGQTYDSNIHMGVEKNDVIGETFEPVGTAEGPFLNMTCKNLVHDQGLACETKPDRWDEVIQLRDPVGGATHSTLERNGFSANYRAMEMIASAMKISMAGYARAQYHPKYYPKAEVYNGGGDLIQTLFQDVVYNIDAISDTVRRNITLTNFYLNVATSLSSIIRVGQPQRFTRSAYNVTGRAWNEAPYVHITWGWFAFMAGELLLAATFLIITMISMQSESGGNNNNKNNNSNDGPPSHRGDLDHFPRDAKDSSLTTLVALSGACREVMGAGVRPAGELERTAKEVRVRLDGNELVPVVKEESLGVA